MGRKMGIETVPKKKKKKGVQLGSDQRHISRVREVQIKAYVIPSRG